MKTPAATHLSTTRILGLVKIEHHTCGIRATVADAARVYVRDLRVKPWSLHITDREGRSRGLTVIAGHWLFRVVLLAAAACGGAPFETGPVEMGPFETGAPENDAGALINVQHDAAHQTHDAGALDGAFDTALEAASEAASNAPDTCAPFKWTPPADASQQGPFKGCIVNEAPAELLPDSYAVVTPKTNGCFIESTPLACRCGADYSCACLLASGSTFCTGDKLLGCDDSLGAPVITCN